LKKIRLSQTIAAAIAGCEQRIQWLLVENNRLWKETGLGWRRSNGSFLQCPVVLPSCVFLSSLLQGLISWDGPHTTADSASAVQEVDMVLNKVATSKKRTQWTTE
jgi:hypothetical protein